MDAVALVPVVDSRSTEKYPSSMARLDWSSYALTAALVVILFISFSLTNRVPIYPLDDAYITVHNAAVLAGRPEVNFIGTPALDGATSVAHTALAAVLCWFLSPLWAVMVAQWIAILLYSLGVVYLAFVYKLSRVQAALLLCAALSAGNTILHLLNGLETGLALAGFVWALALASRSRPSRALAVVCGVLPFLRPELAALSLLLMAQQCWRRWKSGDGCAREISIDLGLVLAGALPWILLGVVNAGSWVPATINAKRFFFAEAHLPSQVKVAWVGRAIEDFVGDLGILAFCGIFAVLVPAGRAALVFATVFLGAFFSQFPGALFHNVQRYPAILVPLFLVGAAAGLNVKSKKVRLLAYGALIGAVLQSVVLIPVHWRTYRNEQRVTTAELESVAKFSNQNVPPGSKLLIHDAGYIGYATKFQLVDLVGLKTPWAVALHGQFTYPTGGRERNAAIQQIAARTRPDYLVVLSVWDRLFRISDALRASGWGLAPVRLANEAAASERPLDESQCYTVYKLTPPVESAGAAQK